MYPTHNTLLPAPKRVRLLWTEFEGWVDIQLRILDRRRDEISKAQDLKWRTVLAKTRAKQDEHAALKAKLFQEAQDNHLSKVQMEWQERLAKANLRDQDWGEMTVQEVQTVEKVLGGDSGDEPPVPVVVTQPQHLSIPVSNPAPPLSSTARAVNLSTSTTSSYTLVSVNEFSTDDELYEAVSSYIVPTDESEDDEHVSGPVPIVHGDKWGMEHHYYTRSSNHSSQAGSPDQLQSSSSSAHDYFSCHPALSRPEVNSAPPKRPPDLERKSGKTRVRGPTYVGPRLGNPEESSEEEDFELFKMQTRVDKIYEFHLAAARADAELAMAIQNDRRTKKSSGKADDAAKVAAHEKQMLKLQAEKEEERKAIVANERKKRREEIRKRSVLGEPGRAANTAPTTSTSQDWEGTLKKGQFVRLDVEKKLFVLGKDETPEQDQNQASKSPRFESAADVRLAPAGQHDTLRARRKSLGRGATPSGWKTKQALATPTTTLSQWPNDAPAAPSPDPSAIPAWMEEAFKDTSLDYSSSVESSIETEDFQPPGAFSAPTLTSPPVPPIPSGWGAKKSGQTAASLLKKVLADPTPTPLPTPAKNKNTPSPPAEALPKAALVPEPKPKPAPSAPSPASTIKKSTKKGRQTIQKKGGASNKGEDEVAGSPTTPTITARPPSSVVSPKDILQRGLAQTQAEDELSSTPRPYGFMGVKRGVGLMADYASDAASTPKAAVRRLGEMSSMGMGMASTSTSGLGAMPWTMEAEDEKELQEAPWERAARLEMMAAAQRAPEARSGWGRVKIGQEQARDEQHAEEETPWVRRQRLKGQVQGVPPKATALAPETNPWLHMQMTNGQGQVPPSRLTEEDVEETPWKRMQRLNGQGQVPPVKAMQAVREENSWTRGIQTAQMADPHLPTSKPSPPNQEEGSLWERRMKSQTQFAFSQRSAPTSAVLSKSTVGAAPTEEESLWNQVMKGRSQIGERHAPVTMSETLPQQPPELEETPWQRNARLKGQKTAPELASASSSKLNIDFPSASTRMHSAKASWGGPVDYDSPVPKLMQQPPPATQSANLFWTPKRGSVNESHMWTASGAGMMKSTKAKKAGVKKVTIEEVPDEEGPGGRKRPNERLPSDSRIILDIVEPKPSVASTTFTNILQYGEEEEDEEEYDTGLSSMVPTPSTAPTSPPGEVPSLDDEEWLMAAAENAKNGNWDHLLNGDGSLAADTLSGTEQVPGGWLSESSAKRPAAGFQMVDSAKLYSALESVEPAAAPPSNAAPASAPPAPAPATSKGAATSPARAPAVAEKLEPTVKPANQNQGKGGKGKGKGKGRK